MTSNPEWYDLAVDEVKVVLLEKQNALVDANEDIRNTMNRAWAARKWVPPEVMDEMHGTRRDLIGDIQELQAILVQKKADYQAKKYTLNLDKIARKNALPQKFMDAAREVMTGAQFDAIMERAKELNAETVAE